MREPHAAVIGHPVAHSRSPELMQQLASERGVALRYERIDVAPDALDALLAELRADRDALGVNVTIPHKNAIAPLLDELDNASAATGAVNVVVRERDGRLTGANTDVAGLLATFDAHEITLRGGHVVVFGAGGAALALAYAVAMRDAVALTIVNRDPVRARRMRDRVAAFAPHLHVHLAEPGAPIAHPVALYVDATPLGMTGFPATSVLPAGADTGAFALDLVYTPEVTPFVAHAQRLGMRAANGMTMLREQARATLDLWFGPR